MDKTDVDRIGDIIHDAVFRNDEHKNILRDMLFGTELDEEDLSLAAGGSSDHVAKEGLINSKKGYKYEDKGRN
jgi:hypothetical protein